jgi:DNA-binding MarR family transcriptional regulator
MHSMKKQRDLTAVQNCACFNVRRVSRAITQFYDAEVRRHGLRPTQTPILNALDAKATWTMAELGDYLGLERTTLLRNLRPLERDGLIATTGGGRGGHVEVAITTQGRRALTRLRPAWRAAQDKVVGILGPARWSALIGDLEHIAAELQTP